MKGEAIQPILEQILVWLTITGCIFGASGYLVRTFHSLHRGSSRRGKRRFPRIFPSRRRHLTRAAQVQYIGCGLLVLAAFVFAFLLLFIAMSSALSF